ncbi:MAG TPA: zinc ribbon domain-containing protein [Candidatus Xenobia bacterium]|jgi:hypothetical protein
MARELTRSTQINTLIGAVDRYQEGQADEQAVSEAFQQTVSFLEHTMQPVIIHQITVAPPGSTMHSNAPALQSALDLMHQRLTEFGQLLEAGDWARLDTVVENLMAATAQAFDVTDRIQAGEVSETQLSPSPFINELMRVGLAVADRRMDPAIFQPLLAANLTRHHTAVAALRPPPGATDAQRGEMRAAGAQHLEGLQEADRYFHDGNPQHIRNGLETANQAVKRLYVLQEAFDQAEQAGRVKSCPRCGADNESSARRCGQCQMALPQTFEEPAAATIDLRVADDVRATGHVMTETTQPLVDLVAAVQSDRSPLSELAGMLKHLEEKSHALWAQLHQVNPAEVAGSAEDLEATRWAQDMMKTGVQEMAEGLNGMWRAIRANDPAGLNLPLDAFLTGSDKLAEVSQQAARVSPPR